MFVHLGDPRRSGLSRPSLDEPCSAQFGRLANYAMGELVTGQVLTYEVAANYKVVAENYNECYHCGPVHPELTRLVPTFGGGGTRHRLGGWRAAPRGRVDVHDERHHRPGAAAGARRGGADPPQGRAGAPEPDDLLLRRPRRGVRAAAAGRRPDPDRVPAAVPPDRRRPTRRSTPPTPATSGTWSTGRTGRSASRCSAACRRGPTATAGSPRWRTTAPTSAAGCSRGWPMTERYDYAVVGLGALGSATAYQLARRGHSVLGLEQFELGHRRGASHDTSRILRHSYHTPEYVDLTVEAYDDWARLEAASGEQLVTKVGGLDLFPARRGDPDGRLHRQPGRGSGSRTCCSTCTRSPARWPQFDAAARDRRAVTRSAARSCPPVPATALMQSLAAGHGAVLRDRSPVTGVRRPRRGRRRGASPGTRRTAAVRWSSAPTPGPTRCWPTSATRSR